MYQANYKVVKAHQIPIELFYSNLSLSLLNASSETWLYNYTGWISRSWKLTWDRVSKTFTQTLQLTSTLLRPEPAKQHRTLISQCKETHVNVICTQQILGTKRKTSNIKNLGGMQTEWSRNTGMLHRDFQDWKHEKEEKNPLQPKSP